MCCTVSQPQGAEPAEPTQLEQDRGSGHPSWLCSSPPPGSSDSHLTEHPGNSAALHSGNKALSDPRVELQLWAPCCAHHKLIQFEIYRNKDIAGTFQCHGLKLRGWPNPNILCVERNDVYNLKPSQGVVTHGLSMAGSSAWCRASSNPPEV